MKNVSISPRKAIAVIRRDFVKDKNSVEQNFKVNEMFNKLKKIPDYQILLKSGAKLFMNDGKFFIGGYTADDSDVDIYFNFKKGE